MDGLLLEKELSVKKSVNIGEYLVAVNEKENEVVLTSLCLQTWAKEL